MFQAERTIGEGESLEISSYRKWLSVAVGQGVVGARLGFTVGLKMGIRMKNMENFVRGRILSPGEWRVESGYK